MTIDDTVYEVDKDGYWRSNGVLVHPIGAALIEAVAVARSENEVLRTGMVECGSRLGPLITELATGSMTPDLAHRVGVELVRISQLVRKLSTDIEAVKPNG